MKMSNLERFAAKCGDVLNREELKTVLGGGGVKPDVLGTCSGSCTQTISTPNGPSSTTGSCTGAYCVCNLLGGVNTSDTCAVSKSGGGE